MIITQTPLRISFAGGGTDFREFYEREEGCVLSTAINKYIFVIVKQRFDQKIRVGYSRTEMVDQVSELQHELVREALRLTGVERQIEISTMSDSPPDGSGLGSSSSVTVGVLNAMHIYQRTPKEPLTLAREACQIEIDILKKPIGKQDQYIAAMGGLQFIGFKPDGAVTVESLTIADNIRRALNDNLMLFWTSTSRKAETILNEQRENVQRRLDVLRGLKALAVESRTLLEQGRLDEFGLALHHGWELKKQMAGKISNDQIDDMYEAARNAGARGGKIAGAGGGGFLLLYCPVEKQECVRAALRGWREFPFAMEPDGTKVIFDNRR